MTGDNKEVTPGRLQAAANRPATPVKVHSVRARRVLTAKQSIERESLVRDMVKAGKRNIDIRRECQKVYGNQLNYSVITSIRREKSDARVALEPGGNANDINELGRAFKKCLALMRRDGIVRATLDTEKDQAVIEIKATRTMSL